VAKLTQSLQGLLFFCNLLFPENGQENSEQNTNQHAGNPGKIDGKVSPTKHDIARQFSQPRNLGAEKQENPDGRKYQAKED